MLLSFLFEVNDQSSLAYRRSCREGICGSCAVNIDGFNTLACLYPVRFDSNENLHINIFPLPHMPIVRDLVVSMDHFYLQYKSISPFLQQHSLFDLVNEISINCPNIEIFNITIRVGFSESENLQSKQARSLLDGLYECILCASRSTSCPSYWWNRKSYLGPAILLQAFRWVSDDRDDFMLERLSVLDNSYKLYRCHSILNCVDTCPKHLDPSFAISSLKQLLKTPGEVDI
jgi:succinate dehydrogenase/fumarate reductase iron-sulfur protein